MNNPFQVRQIGLAVQVWYGPPGEPESEFIMQISPDWLPQMIETLRKIEPCRYPDCVDNSSDGKCTRWLMAECEKSEDYQR